MLFHAVLSTICPNKRYLGIANLVKTGPTTLVSLAKSNSIFCLVPLGLLVSVLVLSCPVNTVLIAACTKKAMQNCSYALSKQVKVCTSVCQSPLLSGLDGSGISGHISS